MGKLEFEENLRSDGLIANMEAPSLRYLTLYTAQGCTLSTLTNSIARSKCSLSELTLINLWATPADMLDLVKVVPTLLKLKLDVIGPKPHRDNNGLTDSFLEALLS